MQVLPRAFALLVLLGTLVLACGRTSLDPLDYGEGGAPVTESGLPPGCGDNVCDNGETCTTCPLDCGLCPGCGDGQCATNENCSSCPADCGVCMTCGNGFCDSGETCLSCAQDCGVCASCGDGKCSPPNETCYTCPADCGKCQGCGNGVCDGNETCASCKVDCGVCAFCGNMKCEAPYETCVNCPADCGDCQTLGCPAMLTCSLMCVDLTQNPPGISLTCVADCIARGCPAAASLFDQAFTCFEQHFKECKTNFGCLSNACQTELAACIGKSHC